MNELRITHLTADHLSAPMGVITTPVFGWQLESSAYDVVQTAYRIQISDREDFSSMLVDTGRVESACSIHAQVAHLVLADAKKYWWRVWVEALDSDAWSDAADFVTGLTTGFTARFVTAEESKDADEDRGTALFKTFIVSGEVEQAYAYCSALGVYHLLLDDQLASVAEMAPGWTSYRKHLLYQTIDVTARLTPGAHQLCGTLGSGWYKGLMGFLHKRNNYGTRTAFLCELVIRYRDGHMERVCTDESWTGADTGVLFSDIYNGEVFDARVGLHHERPAALEPWDMSVLAPQAGGNARIIETLPVQNVWTTPKGETVMDFGQNLTGFVRIRVQGQAGDRVEMQCFEVLDQDGNVYTANLRQARESLTYILNGNGIEEWQPQFTFQGFRYVQIKVWPGNVAPDALTACVVHSDMTPTGRFSCSEPLINRLWHNILWSLKGNFLDIPTDCPQRDERMGWTGDAQIFSATACILMDTFTFYRKWLRDVSADQTPEGGVPHVVPDIITGTEEVKENWLLSQGTHSAAAWADAAVIIPWNLYTAYGDADILREQYDSMKRWIEYMRSHTVDGIWNDKLQFGDWVALDAAEGSYLGATPNDLTCTAYYAYSTSLMAKTAHVLGMTGDAAIYERLYREIVDSFRCHFFTSDGDMTAQTQTAHVLALHFNLVPEIWRAKTVKALKRLLAQRDGHLVTGFVGTPSIAHALSDNGEVAAAYSLVLKRDFPSWLYQITKGATTIWEHWDGIKPDGSMWSADMNSFNHYAYGAIGEWLFHVMGGLRPDELDPGYHTIRFTPRPGGGITSAEASIHTVYGPASISWKQEGPLIEARVTVPCNSRGVLSVIGRPADSTLSLSENGYLTAAFGSGRRVFRWYADTAEREESANR